ncbi:MAG TPA: class II aldolase/adducin family protein [Gaiellaceae bacterium]|nr:class II aldolase/adducin family protein [Gaiellaceae bacterium]
MTELARELVAAGHVLAREGLVAAFGHVSARTSADTALMTPPRPLGTLDVGEELAQLLLEAEELPAGVPGEAWIHSAIYRARPQVSAVCRAQPAAAAAFGVSTTPMLALHGHAAFLGGEVPVHDDARLVRSRELGVQVADRLGDAFAVLLRGNGAVTVGATIGEAVARMWVLESSARLNLAAVSLPSAPRPLSDAELTAWSEVASEVLERIWRALVR